MQKAQLPVTLEVRACILVALLDRAGPALRTVSCPLGKRNQGRCPARKGPGLQQPRRVPGAGVGNTRSPGPVNWRSEEGGERFLLPVGVSVLGCCAGIKMIPKETGASAGK